MTEAARKAWLDRVNARIEAQEARVREAVRAVFAGELHTIPASVSLGDARQLTFPFMASR